MMGEQARSLTQLIAEHKWLAVTAIVIGLVVRLLKSDTKIPINVPPVWRLRLAFALAIASAVVQRISTGVPWREAVVEAVLALSLAVLGHNAVIDNLRGGKEIPIPLLIKPGVAPGPGKPPSLPPPPMPEPEPEPEPVVLPPPPRDELPELDPRGSNETLGDEHDIPVAASGTLKATLPKKPPRP